jgi:hypothetical protein
MASALAPSTCLALALAALLLLAGAPHQVAAHGFVADPVARNLLRPGCGVGCPHCCNGGGPGEGRWGAAKAPVRLTFERRHCSEGGWLSWQLFRARLFVPALWEGSFRLQGWVG